MPSEAVQEYLQTIEARKQAGTEAQIYYAEVTATSQGIFYKGENISPYLPADRYQIGADPGQLARTEAAQAARSAQAGYTTSQLPGIPSSQATARGYRAEYGEGVIQRNVLPQRAEFSGVSSQQYMPETYKKEIAKAETAIEKKVTEAKAADIATVAIAQGLPEETVRRAGLAEKLGPQSYSARAERDLAGYKEQIGQAKQYQIQFQEYQTMREKQEKEKPSPFTLNLSEIHLGEQPEPFRLKLNELTLGGLSEKPTAEEGVLAVSQAATRANYLFREGLIGMETGPPYTKEFTPLREFPKPEGLDIHTPGGPQEYGLSVIDTAIHGLPIVGYLSERAEASRQAVKETLKGAPPVLKEITYGGTSALLGIFETPELGLKIVSRVGLLGAATISEDARKTAIKGTEETAGKIITSFREAPLESAAALTFGFFIAPLALKAPAELAAAGTKVQIRSMVEIAPTAGEKEFYTGLGIEKITAKGFFGTKTAEARGGISILAKEESTEAFGTGTLTSGKTTTPFATYQISFPPEATRTFASPEGIFQGGTDVYKAVGAYIAPKGKGAVMTSELQEGFALQISEPGYVSPEGFTPGFKGVISYVKGKQTIPTGEAEIFGIIKIHDVSLPGKGILEKGGELTTTTQGPNIVLGLKQRLSLATGLLEVSAPVATSLQRSVSGAIIFEKTASTFAGGALSTSITTERTVSTQQFNAQQFYYKTGDYDIPQPQEAFRGKTPLSIVSLPVEKPVSGIFQFLKIKETGLTSFKEPQAQAPTFRTRIAEITSQITGTDTIPSFRIKEISAQVPDQTTRTDLTQAPTFRIDLKQPQLNPPITKLTFRVPPFSQQKQPPELAPPGVPILIPPGGKLGLPQKRTSLRNLRTRVQLKAQPRSFYSDLLSQARSYAQYGSITQPSVARRPQLWKQEFGRIPTAEQLTRKKGKATGFLGAFVSGKAFSSKGNLFKGGKK